MHLYANSIYDNKNKRYIRSEANYSCDYVALCNGIDKCVSDKVNNSEASFNPTSIWEGGKIGKTTQN